MATSLNLNVQILSYFFSHSRVVQVSLSIRYLIYLAMSSFQANATIMTLKLKDESKRDGPRQATCVPCLHWIPSKVDPNVPWSNNASSLQQQPLHYCCVRRSSPTTFFVTSAIQILHPNKRSGMHGS